MPATRARSIGQPPTKARVTRIRLLLVRHAIAEERGARWPRDAKRPLSAKGVRKARLAAVGLKRIGPRPTRVYASPLLRTQQTAALLHRHAHWPRPRACRLLAPGSRPQQLLNFLARELRASTGDQTLAVVGHEPDLSRLLGVCLPGTPPASAFGLRKMGAALLEFARETRPGAARLEWLVRPKQLRALR